MSEFSITCFGLAAVLWGIGGIFQAMANQGGMAVMYFALAILHACVALQIF